MTNKIAWSTPELTVLGSGSEAQGGSGGTSKVADPEEKIAGGSDNYVGGEGDEGVIEGPS